MSVASRQSRLEKKYEVKRFSHGVAGKPDGQVLWQQVGYPAGGIHNCHDCRSKSIPARPPGLQYRAEPPRPLLPPRLSRLRLPPTAIQQPAPAPQNR